MDESNHKKESMDADMYVSHVFEDVRQSYKTLLWTVTDYYQRREHTTYECYAANIKWHLFFIKETTCVKITVESNDLRGEIVCSLVCNENETIHSVSPTKIFEGRYAFRFPYSVIYDPQNKPFEDGHLIFKFKFNEIPQIKKVYAQNPAKKCQSDQLKLLKDLQSFAVRQKLTANANGKDVVVPKALLAARSEFFKESDGEDIIKVNASKESMNIAVEYLYTGVLPVFTKAEDIQELLQVAKVLKIKSLELKCLLLAQRIHDYEQDVLVSN